MAEKELSVVVKLRDELSAKLRGLNTELKKHQREWRATFAAIAQEAGNIGKIMAGFGAVVMAPIVLSVKSALDEMREALKKSKEEIEVYYKDGVMIKKTVNKSGYTDQEIQQMQTAIDQYDSLTNSVRELAISIGQTLLPILLDFINAVTPIINAITSWIARNPELAKQLLVVAATVGTLAVAIGGALVLVSSLSAAFGAMLGPIGLVVLAIMALGAIIAVVVMNWDSIVTALKAANAAVANFFTEVAERFINSIIEMLNIIPNLINSVLSAFGSSYQVNVIPNVKLPRMAAGGIVTQPMTALIGEAGPEAVIPLSEGAGAGFGGTNVYVTVQGSVQSERDLAETIRKQILRSNDRNYSSGF